MSTRLAIACSVVALCFGCGKQGSSVAPGAPSVAAPAEGAPAGTTADQIAALLVELTQTARRYAAEQQRVPKTVDELVGNGYLNALPQAPPGKRFAISQNLQVYLADP
jgi:hypothetical protein